MNVSLGFVVAMKEEADIIASHLGLETSSDSPRTYSNKDNSIVLLTAGEDPEFLSFHQPVSRVGKVSAGVITTLLVERYHPKIIINAGTAGGVKSAGAQVGDVILATHVTNHDIHIPLPGYNEYGSRLISLPEMPFLKTLTGIKRGIVSSGESFFTYDHEWEHIIRTGVIAKEMECAAVLQALQILQSHTQCVVIKGITDVIDKNMDQTSEPDEFLKNFTLTMNNVGKKLTEIVTYFSRQHQEHSPSD